MDSESETGCSVNSSLSNRFDRRGIDRRNIYLLAEHRRHQILPGRVRYGDTGLQGLLSLFYPSNGNH